MADRARWRDRRGQVSPAVTHRTRRAPTPYRTPRKFWSATCLRWPERSPHGSRCCCPTSG